MVKRTTVAVLSALAVFAASGEGVGEPAQEMSAAAAQCAPAAGDTHLGDALLHVPAGKAGPLPLILAFHGAGGTGDGMADYSGLSDAADAHGFAVLYPTAARRHFWALNRASGTEDIERLRALLPQALEKACGDPKRVYATGVSNGGGFTARVGCELPIAAIAPVAGGYRALDPCPSNARTSVLEIHGDKDGVVPYAGKAPDYRGAVPRYLDGWAHRNGCTHTVTTHPAHAVTKLRYTDCTPGLAVEHLKLAGTDHGWPGAPPPFPTHNPSGLNANEAILRFFSQH